MNNRVLLFGYCVILSVSTQTLDDLISSPNPVVIQEPKPSSSSSTDSKWDDLMPALQSLKSTSKIKKERLYKIVKIIKFLLSDEMEKKGEGKEIMEEFKEKINETESNDTFPEPTMPDVDSIVEERLECIKEINDDRTYMLDTTEVKNKTEIVKDEPAPKNKSADFSKIFSKTATALAQLKDKNQDTEIQTPKFVPIFRPKNGCNKNDFNPTFPEPTMPNVESIVEERLECIKEIVDDRTYMLDKTEVKNKTEIVKNEPASKNKSADLSKIFSKVTTALAKLKDQNQDTEIQPPTLVQIFRPKHGCKKDDFNPKLHENPKQLGNLASGQTAINPMSSLSMFNIPCQKASDILEETANFPLPRDIFCDNPAVNLKSLAKNTKLDLENLPFQNVVPNSITCVDSDNSIAILFKPKTISLMQVFENLLKKITVTVLVPYYVSKLAV